MKLPDYSVPTDGPRFDHLGLEPPRPALYSLYSLHGQQSADAGLGYTRGRDGATRWQLFALTGASLIYVSAAAGFAQWSYSSPMPEAGEYELDAVMLPLSTLTAIEVVGLRERSDGHEAFWSIDYVAAFGDRRIPLPPTTESSVSDERASIEAFALALISRLH